MIVQFVIKNYIMDCTIQNIFFHYGLYNPECKFAVWIIQSRMQICIPDCTIQNVKLYYELYNAE